MSTDEKLSVAIADFSEASKCQRCKRNYVNPRILDKCNHIFCIACVNSMINYHPLAPWYANLYYINCSRCGHLSYQHHSLPEFQKVLETGSNLIAAVKNTSLNSLIKMKINKILLDSANLTRYKCIALCQKIFKLYKLYFPRIIGLINFLINKLPLVVLCILQKYKSAFKKDNTLFAYYIVKNMIFTLYLEFNFPGMTFSDFFKFINFIILFEIIF